MKYRYGIFALLLFGLFSVFLYSDNVSALKYNYSSLNFSRYYVYYASDSAWNVGSGIVLNVPQSNALSSPSLPSQSIKSEGSPCYQSSTTLPLYSTTTNTHYYELSIYKNFPLPGISLSGSRLCHYYERNTWYEYDSIRIAPDENSSNSSHFYTSDLFGNNDKYMYSFTLPLQFNTETVGAVSSGRQFQFHVGFRSLSEFLRSDLDGNHLSWENQRVILNVTGVYHDSNNEFHPYEQSFEFTSSSNYCTNLVRSVDGFKVYADCYWTSPYDFDITSFDIRFISYQEYNVNNFNRSRLYPVWYTAESSVMFDEFYVITDNNNDYGGDASLPMSGSNIGASPAYNYTSGESYTDSLLNLFNFSIVNPFAPIFQMFSNNSECASIPIIAGMLGSEETTYCPWFDSTTRNVLSPVLGLASVMLLFGFFVRWLGSSSGNMFEDQTSHKWTNTTFGQKGSK